MEAPSEFGDQEVGCQVFLKKIFAFQDMTEILKHVESWNFPIFKFHITARHPLADMGYFLFKDIGLIDHFKLPVKKLRNFLVMLNQGYTNISTPQILRTISARFFFKFSRA